MRLARALVVAVALAGASNVADAAPTVVAPRTASGFVIVPSPSRVASLADVAGLAPSDVWAVGANFPGGVHSTLTMHWNGLGWSVVPSPNPSPSGNDELFSVDAAPDGTIWSVGDSFDLFQGIALRWTGTRWRAYPVPADVGTLSSVKVFSRNDAWAVGENSSVAASVIIHWNGTAWSDVVDAPLVGPRGYAMTGVDGAGPHDVYASGVAMFHGANRSFVEHWDGAVWTLVTTTPRMTDDFLLNTSVASRTEAWVVGSTGLQPAALHWNGARWKTVNPPAAAGNHELSGVTDNSPTDAWAVGRRQNASAVERTLIERWNGTTWADLGGPNAGGATDDNQLFAVTAIPGHPNDLWAVGAGPGGPLILHHPG